MWGIPNMNKLQLAVWSHKNYSGYAMSRWLQKLFRSPPWSFSPILSTEKHLICLTEEMLRFCVMEELQCGKSKCKVNRWRRQLNWDKRLCAALRWCWQFTISMGYFVFLSICHRNWFDNLFASCRWVPEVEKFQLASPNSPRIDRLSCFCPFIGPLHSTGNNPPLHLLFRWTVRTWCDKSTNHVSSQQAFSVIFLFCRASYLKSLHGFFLSSEASAMLTGPQTFGPCTMVWIKL